jgi:Spy/CpxP family protein refolding chaperone
MKNPILGLVVATLLSATAVWAEPGNRPDREERLQRMQQHLGLSEEQVAQIRDIRAQGGTREDVHAVLTEEQRSRMAQARKQHRQQRPEQHRQQGPADNSE